MADGLHTRIVITWRTAHITWVVVIVAIIAVRIIMSIRLKFEKRISFPLHFWR